MVSESFAATSSAIRSASLRESHQGFDLAGDGAYNAVPLGARWLVPTQISHLVQGPDFDHARSWHGIGTALNPSDRLLHVFDFPARSRRPARGFRRKARR